VRDWFIGASEQEFWVLVSLSAAAGLLMLWLGFRSLRRARLIEDTPTARIRSAHQGYVELEGHARLMAGPTIICPLSYSRCVWYRYSVERRETTTRNGRRRTRWRAVNSGSSDDLFLLADTTGECIVDPDGALVTPSIHRVWYGASARPDRVPRNGRAWFGFGQYRYTERLILIGDYLYALGQFRTQGIVSQSFSEHEDVRELLADWKRDQRELLARFDANQDGTVDLEEWESARRAAIEQVRARHVEQSLDPDLHVLSRSRDGRPYLLSTRRQEHVVRDYRISAAWRIGLALMLIGLALYALQSRGVGGG